MNDYDRIIAEAEYQVAEGEVTWEELFRKLMVVIKEEEEEHAKQEEENAKVPIDRGSTYRAAYREPLKYNGI